MSRPTSAASASSSLAGGAASGSSSSSSSSAPQDYRAAAEEMEREAAEAEAERSFTLSVLKRVVDWAQYQKMGDISFKEQGHLLDYDKVPAEEQDDLLTEKGVIYAQLFVKCLDKLRAREAVEYLVVLVQQLLVRDEQRASFFHQSAKQNGQDIFSPFMRILTSADQYHAFTVHTAAAILATLFAAAPQTTPQQHKMLASFVTYLSTRLSGASGRELQRVLLVVKALLKGSDAQLVWIREGGLAALAQLLHKETQNAQLIYLTAFCFWLLTFNVAAAAKPMQEQGVIRKLVQIVKANVMEKVVRITYSIFRNLLDSSDRTIVEELIGHGLVSLTDTLSKRKFKDADLMSDMDVVSRTLLDQIQKLSTFEIYQTEVMSGSLKESPVHTNEAFWRENIAHFEQNNFRIVTKLVSIAKDVNEAPEVREIAAWDLGEFARFHPDGRRIVTKLGGKSALMLLMTEKNQKLAKAALLATQKIMVSWEFLQKSSAAGVQSLVSNKK